MINLGDSDAREMGKLFGIVVFVGAGFVYLVGRIIKGFKTRGADRTDGR